MKGDFSRLPFDPRKHYTAVWMQQGRVQLDADWNEQVAISNHRARTAIGDAVGHSGAPERDPGFRPILRGGLAFSGHESLVVPHVHGLIQGGDATVEVEVELRPGGKGGTIMALEHGFTLSVDPGGTLTFTSADVRRPEREDAAVTDARAMKPSAPDDAAATDPATPVPPSGGAESEEPDGSSAASEPPHGESGPSAAHEDVGAGASAPGSQVVSGPRSGPLRAQAALSPGVTALVSIVMCDRRADVMVDGVLVAAGSLGHRQRQVPGRLLVGAAPHGHGTAEFLDGLAYAVRLWERARTPGEIRRTLGHTPAGAEPGLWACWPLSEGEGDITRDVVAGRDARLGGDGGRAPRWLPASLRIGAGRFYVDGILCENETELDFEDQPDLPGANLPDLDRFELYLDVWERFLTVADDPSIREVALRGADTTGRTRIVWQVKAAPALPAESADPGGMAARRQRPAAGGGNQLYRVQIHDEGERFGLPRPPASSSTKIEHVDQTQSQVRVESTPASRWRAGQLVEVFDRTTDDGGRPGALTRIVGVTPEGIVTLSPFPPALAHSDGPRIRPIASFIWSADNASTAFPIASLDSRSGVATLQDVDEGARGIGVGDWVEVENDVTVLQSRPGALCRITAVDHGAHQVTLAPPPPAGLSVAAEHHPVLRRWEAGHPAAELRGASMPVTGSWQPLDAGVEVRFDGTDFAAGDYWTVPIRELGHSGIEWPTASGRPLFRPPQGIHHHRAHLATVTRVGGRVRVDDHRRVFPPMDGGYVRRDGPESMTGPLVIEQDLTVGGNLRVEGVIHGELAAGTVGEDQVRDRAITARKLADDAGLVPAGCYILGESPDAPVGYETVGSPLVLLHREPRWHVRSARSVAEGRLHALSSEAGIYVLSDGDDEVWLYEPDRKRWHSVTRLPARRRDFAAALVNDKIHLVGGRDASGRLLDEHQAYDIQDDAWTALAPMPRRLSGSAAVAVDGRLHVLGGMRRCWIFGLFSTGLHHVYDASADRWHKRASLPRTVRHPGVAEMAGTLFLAGGMSASLFARGPSRVAAGYDRHHDSWRGWRSLRHPRNGMGLTAVENRVFVAGGYREDGPMVSCECFDPTLDVWRAFPALELPLRHLALAAFRGKLFAFGGGPYDDQESLIQECRVFEILYPYRRREGTWSDESTDAEGDG